jgi:para-aminobenzoate synthetase component 1
VVVPEQVVTLSKRGELCFFGEHSEGSYNELLAMDLDEQEHQEFKSTVSFTGVEQSISQGDYTNCVNAIKEDITRGDYYEINLCIELLLNQLHIDQPFALHQRLLQESPTPFSSFVKLHHQHLLSASPERFLLGQAGSLVSQPIKGTSRRFGDTAKDQASKAALLASEKERAEHIMIVDLMRNDLSRSAAVGSVRVPELCEIYSYRQVHQMVSTITSQPKAGIDWLTAMEHCFPMGSMTGAPKRRVLQAIAQYEPCARGWFSGSVGYIKPNGEFDSNVVIRSLLYDSQKQQGKYSVGSAITIDSDPEAEYEECLLKASAIRKVLN